MKKTLLALLVLGVSSAYADKGITVNINNNDTSSKSTYRLRSNLFFSEPRATVYSPKCPFPKINNSYTWGDEGGEIPSYIYIDTDPDGCNKIYKRLDNYIDTSGLADGTVVDVECSSGSCKISYI